VRVAARRQMAAFEGTVDQHNVGRSREVCCDELLARHADYLDGLLAPHEAARLQLHMELCTSCARYDRIVRHGTELVRDLPEITPSSDFELRLQHRIFHLEDSAALRDSRPAASAMATFAVAGVIALLAWSPLLLTENDDVAVTSVPAVRTIADAEAPLSQLPQHTPLLSSTRDVWQPLPSLSSLSNGETVRVMAAFPGPYSPLVVQPPVHGRSVRTISTEYPQID
jgi:hypothetical protein